VRAFTKHRRFRRLYLAALVLCEHSLCVWNRCRPGLTRRTASSARRRTTTAPRMLRCTMSTSRRGVRRVVPPLPLATLTLHRFCLFFSLSRSPRVRPAEDRAAAAVGFVLGHVL
jgi:hypothetical protein